MDKDFKKSISQCPCCGSENRFFEQMAEEMRERGLARQEWNFHLDLKEGIVLDEQRAESIPIGSEVPVYSFKTDICIDCGCIYVKELVRTNFKRSLPTAQPPNRAQRR